MGIALAVNLTITSERAYQNAAQDLRVDSNMATDLLSQSLSGLIYTYQLPEAQKLLDKFLQNEQFVAAKVVDIDDKVLASSGTVTEADEQSFVLVHEIDQAGEKLADLTVIVSYASIDEAVADAFMHDSMIGSLQILGILVVVYLGTSKLIEALAKAHDQTRSQARHDPLTGLLNRRGINDSTIEMLRGRTDVPIGLIHIDLDGFKSVNDSLGHATGDKVLLGVSEMMRASLREKDLLARVGGDEFLVVFEMAQRNAGLADFASRLIAKLNGSLPEEISRIKIGASAGVHAFTWTCPADFDRALIDVDLAMYDAKKRGRGLVEIYRPELRDSFDKAERLLEDLKFGLERSEFEPWFQPQINTLTGEVDSIEALVRWRHPDRGIEPPATFIKAAEQAGLLDQIDRQVFSKALDALRLCRQSGLPDLRLAVNLTISRLEDPTLCSQLETELVAAGFEPRDVSLEILETAFLDSADECVSLTIHRLAEAGFHIELDDFGTGHASIANLTAFPVSRLKIDRCFIAGIDQDLNKQKITKVLLQLGRDLDITTVAEGVETESEMDTLIRLGCASMQGFLFAKPLDADSLQSWLQPMALRRIHAMLENAGKRCGGAEVVAPLASSA